MSLTNLNNNIYPLTLDGLQTAYLDSLYINNNLVVPGNYIPYTGASSAIDLNNQPITNVASVTASGAITGASVFTTGAISGATITASGALSGNTLAVTNNTSTGSLTSIPTSYAVANIKIESSTTVLVVLIPYPASFTVGTIVQVYNFITMPVLNRQYTITSVGSSFFYADYTSGLTVGDRYYTSVARAFITNGSTGSVSCMSLSSQLSASLANLTATGTNSISNLTTTGTLTTNGIISGTLSGSTITASTSLNTPIGNITTLNATTVNTTNVIISGAISGSTITASTSLNTPIGNITTLNSTTVNATNLNGTTITGGNTTLTGTVGVLGTFGVSGNSSLLGTLTQTGTQTFNLGAYGSSGDYIVPTTNIYGSTVYDGGNLVNIQNQASQYGRNILMMTGRYEASNDAWSFVSPRNGIIFRTQATLNASATNRYTIQNYFQELGIMSAGKSNVPITKWSNDGTMTHTDNINVGGIITLTGSNDVFKVANTATFSAKNSGGTYEAFLWPRWSDNVMYLNYGTGGFNIRNNASTNVMYLTNAGNVGIGNSTPICALDTIGVATFGLGHDLRYHKDI